MENREQPFYNINSENYPQRADNRVLEVNTQRLRPSQALKPLNNIAPWEIIE